MISAILAVDENGTIGNKGDLPWPRIPEDMKWFKDNTENNVVVMGRTTWESLGKYAPLPNRINVVVSKQNVEGANKVISKDILYEIKALQHLYNNKEIFIIGGAMLYESTADIIDKVYLTTVFDTFEGDTKVDLDKLTKGKVIQHGIHSTCEKNGFDLSFRIYRNRIDND